VCGTLWVSLLRNCQWGRTVEGVREPHELTRVFVVLEQSQHSTKQRREGGRRVDGEGVQQTRGRAARWAGSVAGAGSAARRGSGAGSGGGTTAATGGCVRTTAAGCSARIAARAGRAQAARARAGGAAAGTAGRPTAAASTRATAGGLPGNGAAICARARAHSLPPRAPSCPAPRRAADRRAGHQGRRRRRIPAGASDGWPCSGRRPGHDGASAWRPGRPDPACGPVRPAAGCLCRERARARAARLLGGRGLRRPRAPGC